MDFCGAIRPDLAVQREHIGNNDFEWQFTQSPGLTLASNAESECQRVDRLTIKNRARGRMTSGPEGPVPLSEPMV